MRINGNDMTPLEMEALTEGDADMLAFSHIDNDDDDDDEPKPAVFVMPNINILAILQNLWTLIVAHASYYRTITIPITVIATIVVVVLLLNWIAYSTTQRHVASVSHDYTDAHSIFELKMQQIDHWCLSGGDDDCRCDDPTVAQSKGEQKGWTKAHKKNKELVSDYTFMSNIDLVMVGDQGIEEWNGRWYGVPNDDYQGANDIFLKSFTTQGGGTLNAVALGIAGDSITNLLWRLQHGEMPAALTPKVWWISIGLNDLARGQCSEEATILGILRLAEYIATERPGSIVVINSILPSVKVVKPRNKQVHFKSFDLFPSIQVVNGQLSKFASKHADFQFFDATNLFFASPPPAPASSKEKKKKRKHEHKQHMPDLVEKYISSEGKLTVSGHKKWATAIVEEVTQIIYEAQYEAGLYDDMVTDYDDMYLTDDYRF